MKGFGIYVKNDLLDPKHMTAMQVSNKTTALWLYLWFLDKVTKIDPATQLGVVLGRKPISLEEITDSLQCDVKTARKMFHCLQEKGYIQTIRTPYGHQVYVTKAVKIFGNKVAFDKTEESKNLVGLSGKNLVGLYTNVVGLDTKSGRSKKTEQYDNTNTTPPSGENLKTNEKDMWNKTADDFEGEMQIDPDYKPVRKKKEKSVSDDVQSVFDLFPNPAKVTWRMREIERVSAQALFETYGLETLKKRIDRIEKEKKNKDPMFPLAVTPSQLLDKMPNIERYFSI